MLVTHRSTCDGQLKLSPRSSNQFREVIAYTLQDAKPIVLGQRSQEVLDGVPFVSPSSVLQKLLYNLGLVGRAQGRSLQDHRQFRVFLEDARETKEGLGSAVKSRGFHGGSVLSVKRVSIGLQRNS